jgi:hypothetical protein
MAAFGLDVAFEITGRRGDAEVREDENAFLVLEDQNKKYFPSRARAGWAFRLRAVAS